jgi:hypothetical protein
MLLPDSEGSATKRCEHPRAYTPGLPAHRPIRRNTTAVAAVTTFFGSTTVARLSFRARKKLVLEIVEGPILTMHFIESPVV